jgi:hypothetical protein
MVQKEILENIFENNTKYYYEEIIPFIYELKIFKNKFKNYIIEKDLISIKNICGEIRESFIFLNANNLFDHIINALDEICDYESGNIIDYKEKIGFFNDFDYNDFISDLIGNITINL